MPGGNTQKDAAGLPVSSVSVPNTSNSDFTPLRGANTSTDSNGMTTAAASMVVENAIPLGQATKVNSSPVVIASDQFPLVEQQQIVAATLASQSFSAAIHKLAATGTGPGLSIFNNSTVKTVIIYSFQMYNGTSGNYMELRTTTADPALGTPLTPVNSFVGSGTASLMTCSYATTTATRVGTVYGSFNGGGSTMTEFLTNGSVVILPPGVARGVVAYTDAAAANTVGFTVRWFEY